MTNAKTWRKMLAAASLTARVYLGGVFVAASLYKLWEPREFAVSVATYQMMPLELLNLFAIVLPVLELIAGVALIVGFWTRASAGLVSAMMIMFLVALGYALANDMQMSCGCFASQETIDEIGLHTVFRDLGWLALGVFIMIVDDGRLGLDRFFLKKERV